MGFKKKNLYSYRNHYYSGWTVTHVPPAHVIEEKLIFLVSLPTLSNQDRELHKEAVLSVYVYEIPMVKCVYIQYKY